MPKPNRFIFGPLKSEPKYRPFITFDTETRPNLNGRGSSFVLGVVYDGVTARVFHDRITMIRHLMSRQYAGYTAWASNLEYDLNVLFQEATWPVFYAYFGGMLKSAKLLIRSRTRKSRKGYLVDNNEWLHFADTLNHWPGGVGEYGKLLGIDKLDMPVVVPTRELETYCCRDAEIVYRMVERCQHIYNEMGCELKGSIASSAKDLFRREYFDEDHAYWPLKRKDLDLFRGGYYGARTENFFKGITRKVWMGDVVSLYPHIMRELELPVISSRMPTSKRIRDEYEGMAAVDIEVRKGEHFPPLPFRYDKLYFPTGRWTGIFPLNELRYAEQNGVKINRVHFAVQFRESAHVFRNYVDGVFPMKLNATNALDEATAKLFLNSLYGVFGTGFDSMTIGPSWYDGSDLPGDVHPNLYHHKKTGHALVTGDQRYPSYTNFVWPSYITGQGRIILHELLGRYAALYCDTDSVASHKRIRKCRDLGALDLKYFTEEMEILAPKVYRDDRKVKVKGVPRHATGVHDLFEDDELVGFRIGPIKDLKRLADRFFYQRASRFRESLRRDLPPNTWHWVEKRLRFIGEKRNFLANGESDPMKVEKIMKRRLAPGLRVKVLPSFKIRQIKTRIAG